MKKLTTYLLSTGCIIAAAAAMSVASSATVTIDNAFETETVGEETTDKTTYENIDKFAAALAKAKPTGTLKITIDSAETLKTSLKIPKSLDSVEITGAAIDASKAKSISIDCATTINNTITGGAKVKFTTKSDLTIGATGEINDFAALSGAKTATLTIANGTGAEAKNTESFNFPVSGFGTVTLPQFTEVDFIGGTKGDALKVAKLDVAGTARVYANPITIDALTGAGTITYVTTGTADKKIAHSYINIKKEVAETTASLENRTKYTGDTTLSAAPVAFDSANKVLVIKAKDFEELGLKLTDDYTKDATGSAEAGIGGVKYALSNKKGTYTVRSASYNLTATGLNKTYTTWDEVAAYLNENGSSDTAYTVTLNYDTREDGGLKFPKKDTFKTLTIKGKTDGTQSSWSFTGGISTTGDVVLKDLNLNSYKLNKKGKTDAEKYVPQQMAISAGKFDLTLDNAGCYVNAAKDNAPIYFKSIGADELTLLNTDNESGYSLEAVSVKANALRLGNSNITEAGEDDPNGKTIALSVASASFKDGITNLLDTEGKETARAGEKIKLTFVDKKTLNTLAKDLEKIKVSAATYGNQFSIQNVAADKYEFAYSGTNLIPTDPTKESVIGLVTMSTEPVIAAGLLSTSDAATKAATDKMLNFKTIKDASSYIEKQAKASETAASNYYDFVFTAAAKDLAIKLPKADTYKQIAFVNNKKSGTAQDPITVAVKGKLTLTGNLTIEEGLTLVVDKPEKNIVNKVDAKYVNKENLKASVVTAMNNVEATYKAFNEKKPADYAKASDKELAALKELADKNAKAVDEAKDAIKALYNDAATPALIIGTFKIKKGTDGKWAPSTETTGVVEVTWTKASGETPESFGTGLFIYDGTTGVNCVNIYEVDKTNGFPASLTAIKVYDDTNTPNSKATKEVKVSVNGAAAANLTADMIAAVKSDVTGVTGAAFAKSDEDEGKIKATATKADLTIEKGETKTATLTFIFKDGGTATVSVDVERVDGNKP